LQLRPLMHTYDFHIGDYARDTRHLSLLEHGAYRLLLDLSYSHETPLTKDLQVLVRKVGAKTAAEKKAVESCLQEFFIDTPEGWTHKRVIKERGEAGIRSLKGRYSQVLRWWRQKKWADEPSLEDYLKNPESYHDPITGHIRNPYDCNTTVSNRNSYQPPTANRQPPYNVNTPLIPQGGEKTDLLTQRIEPITSPQEIAPQKKKKGRAGRLDAPVFADEVPAAYREPLARWFAYKRERGQGYTVTGWETLVSQQQRFPSTAVSASVEASMASNYTGLFTERIQQQQYTRNGTPHPSENTAPLQVQPQASIPGPPAGYERAMAALFGDDWSAWSPGWYGQTPSDRAAVLAWIQNNETTLPTERTAQDL